MSSIDQAFLIAAERYAGAHVHEMAQHRQVYILAHSLGRWAQADEAKRKAYALMREVAA